MNFAIIANRLNKKLYRRKHRRMLQKWWADGERWFVAHGVDGVQLMKINIEGGEFELLERLLETGSISRIENIQVQFHNVAVESARRMERIQEDMRATHEPTYQYRFVWENWVRRADAR